MYSSFMTPEEPEKFVEKKLFIDLGKIQWGAVTYIEKSGGEHKVGVCK